MYKRVGERMCEMMGGCVRMNEGVSEGVLDGVCQLKIG